MASSTHPSRENSVRKYGAAVATAALALLFTWLIDDPITEPNTLLLFIAAVAFSSWYGGLGPGLLATALNGIASAHFLLSGDGTRISMNVIAVRLGEFVLVSLLICLLNSARLWAQRHAEEAHAEALVANSAKDVFLASASHELRTPLVSIMGWTTMLRNNVLPDAESAKALEIIARNAKMLRMLVDDLLDVSRITTGKVHLNCNPVELTNVMTDALDIVRPTVKEKGIEVELCIGCNKAPVSGDYERLQQVIWNLLANAVKFTPHGGSIQISLDATDEKARISIKDTGIGIAPETLLHIFERFHQAAGALSQGGLGLGLSIARHLTELHGGHILAESAGEGCGSTFTLMLPLLCNAENETSAVVNFNTYHDQPDVQGAASL